jgi:hypothetical protein
MLKLSADPDEAARETDAVLYYLAAFGFVDGKFDASEREFVDEFILALAESQEPDASTPAARARRASLVDRLDRKLQRIDAELAALWDEPTAEGERAVTFVRARMKVRCLEIFESFGPENRKVLLDAIEQILEADGVAHPEEVQFRDELFALFEGRHQPRAPAKSVSVETGRNRVFIHPHIEWPPTSANHDTLTRVERHYSPDTETFDRQLRADVQRIHKAIKLFDSKRVSHQGVLAGSQTVQELVNRGTILDGHVHVLQPTRPTGYELTVLGDLHGCYSCLKAALMQTDFLGKVDRFTKAPHLHPEPLLVLLGDYIDRGIYSYQGVLRAVLDIFIAAPNHVIILRGNHEYYFERNGDVLAAVKPADALDELKPYAPIEVLQAYRQLFEAMPNMLFFDDIMFVHAGIPRDSALRERYEDLSSLNDPVLRFQMMWSDPSTTDFVPEELQDASNRFAFGREQAREFMHRIGVRTLIRGHEKVDEGYVVNIDEPDLRIITLFSAGGADNYDLPETSSYRRVIPSALTIRYRAGRTDIEPWVIDYATYNDPERNEFYNEDSYE